MMKQIEMSNNQTSLFSITETNNKLLRTFINILFVLGLITITCIAYHYSSKDIILKIAYGGASPINYVAEKQKPENFEKNWEAAGVGKMDYTITMKVFYWLDRYFSISPTKTLYPFMFIQTLLFVMSVAFLVQTLFNNKIVTFISVTVVLLSSLAGLNLSRFGAGYGSFSPHLYYNYANAFRFIALAFFFRNKFTPCFVFLALSIYCHVNMGLFALAFIGFYVLYKPKIIRANNFLIGIFIFSILVGPYIFSIISNAEISSGGIPVDQWVKSTRIFCFHWYPITMKLFSTKAHNEFFPLLLLCFFFFAALRYRDFENEKTRKVIIGSIGCLIMSIIGIIVSDIFPIPFLIKISLQRATGLISFFGVLYLIYYLFMKVKTGNIFIAFLAIYSLLILVFAKPGIAVLPLFLLLHSDIRDGHIGPIKLHHDKIKAIKIIYYVVAIFLFFLTLVSIIKLNPIYEQLWTPLQYFNPFRGFDFLLRGGRFKVDNLFIYLVILSVLTAGTIIVIKRVEKRCSTTLALIFLFVISVSTVWYLERVKYLKWHDRYAETASSYLDVQLWAKENSPYDALFMPDPSHGYGWRDFSERSSFGSLREWGFTSIAYNPKYKTYLEGIKRMKEFGIDINEITNEDLRDSKSRIYGQKLARDIRSVFYSMKTEKLKELSGKYGIDYIVMNKKYHKNKFNDFKVPYENNHFVVYKP